MSFRKFGGMNYATRHNIVKSKYNTIDDIYVTNGVGQINSNITLYSDISGNVVISGDLDVSGNTVISGTCTASSYSSSSDYRIKKNVKSLDETYNVDNLNPVTYINNKLEKQDVGFIAHEVQEIYPFLVTGDKDGQDIQTLNYNGLIGILVNEIKNMKKEIAILKNEFKKNETKI
jgi:hypothetical protein